jgi:hypothetical protein
MLQIIGRDEMAASVMVLIGLMFDVPQLQSQQKITCMVSMFYDIIAIIIDQ